MTKTLDEYFRDWESHTFGFGYGTGEPHTIPAVKRFLELCNEGGYGNSYRYERLEEALTPTVAWLLINAMARVGVTDYGTSPRRAWLTEHGMALKAFVAAKTADELVEIATDYTEDYIHCYPDICNCGPDGYRKGVICPNPFWKGRT